MAAAILPHRPPLRFVTEVVREGPCLRAQARVDGGPAVRDGRIRPAYLIEVAAQAAAAAAGEANGGEVSGALVAVRGWRDLRPVAVPADLVVTVREEAVLGSAARYRATVHHAGEAVAEGSFQVQRSG